MISFPLGLLTMILVLGYSLSGAHTVSFINLHSIVLVIGGTIAALWLATPSREIRGMLRSVADLRHSIPSPAALSDDLLALSKRRDAAPKTRHPLILHAQDLWDKGVESQMLMALLGRRMEELNGSTEQGVATLRNIAKYPPALGMTGTVIGLVSLFSSLTPDNRQGLGPLLAMAMTATFYGLVLSNAVLMPLADRLYVMHLGNARTNEQVFKILLLIHQQEAHAIIEDELRGGSLGASA